MYSRPIFAHRSARGGKGARGFTIVEILVALTLTLILMTTVVTVFGRVGTSMRNARRALEQFDRLRTTGQQLNMDLNGITARLDGRAGRPEEGLGYLELIEGSYLFPNQDGNNTTANAPAAPYYGINSSVSRTDPRHYDYTVGERGDILMFTSRNAARPFVGRFGQDASGNPQTIQSDVAEVSWYLRGNRLHRRVLLVVPGVASTAFAPYIQTPKLGQVYNDYDLSIRMTKDAFGNPAIVPNSLADLVKRENRFAHDARPFKFPFDVRGWGKYGLPTLAECTSPTFINNPSNGWTNGSTPPPPFAPSASPAISGGTLDLWDNSPNGPLSPTQPASANPYADPGKTNLSDQALTYLQSAGTLANDGTRVADDVVLTNVIGFDVKVWEPAANNGAGGYVDLGAKYGSSAGTPSLPVTIVPNNQPSIQPYVPASGPTYPRFIDMSAGGCQGGIFESGLSTAAYPQCVYDSGCFSYANELGNSQATNGLDDSKPNTLGAGVVDDMSEYVVGGVYAPGVLPYPVPLRGIQVTIRCFEPDSKQIREITIEHDFLPK